MKSKAIAWILITLFLSSALTTMFTATSGQTTKNALTNSFQQSGKFYTLAGRVSFWEIIEEEKITHYEDAMDKWSVQDVDDDIAIINRTVSVVYIYPETSAFRVETYDLDYKIAADRTILWAYYREMYFIDAGFESSWEMPLDMDIGEHTRAWFPTNLYIGAKVSGGWVGDSSFLDDTQYEVTSEEVIQVLGEKQDCWILHMPPSITIDGTRVRSNSWWVDKDTGVPLKAYWETLALDGSWGYEEEDVLVRTNIDLGPESTQFASPTYTLTVPTTPGFPEAGKFYSWYYLTEGWYVSGATNVTYYTEGLWTWFATEVTNDVAVVKRIMWSEYVCEAEGAKELEVVSIRYYSYRISTATRSILDITCSAYSINMTSLTWSVVEMPPLTCDIGEKTYCWLPTNLHIGATVDITWTGDDTLDNATYTVTSEKIISTLGETQKSWALYLPPTTTVDEKYMVTETLCSDKDVGIGLEYISKSQAIDGSSASVSKMQLMGTNINLGPEVALSIKLSGEFDYLYLESVKIRLAALVTDSTTMEPVSGADVTVDIINPEGNVWSVKMVEKHPGTGIYEWQSSDTIKVLRSAKGVYLVHARASFPSGPTASGILEFHIDPPADSGDLTTLMAWGVVVLVLVVASLSLRKIIDYRLCRTTQQSKMHSR